VALIRLGKIVYRQEEDLTEVQQPLYAARQPLRPDAAGKEANIRRLR
jgi:hypothetical protein